MIQPAVISANARAAGASMVLSVGGAAMGPFAAIPAAVAAQEAVHEAVLAKEVKDFQQKAEQALQKAGVRNATEAVRRQVQALQKEADEESALAEAQAQEAAVAKANTLKLAMGATALLAIGGVVWWVRRRAEEP